jgi:hypothetical protein
MIIATSRDDQQERRQVRARFARRVSPPVGKRKRSLLVGLQARWMIALMIQLRIDLASRVRKWI